ncbi:MAG: RsmB/NOP family class I SAM-dependent RNA methyltransferase [Victivallaceae bacterium]
MTFSRKHQNSAPRRPTDTISELKLRSQTKLALDALCEVLRAVFGGGKPADRALSGFFREHHQCGSRDRQFISEAVFAVFRNWGTLRKYFEEGRCEEIEHGNGSCTSRELDMLLYGALALERPDFPATGFVLGTSRAKFKVSADPADRMPEWVAKYVTSGFPLEAYAARLGERPPIWLRLQTPEVTEQLRRFGLLGFQMRQVPGVDRAVALYDAKINLFTLADYREGKFEVQDLASQAIGLVASPKPGERWFDACAGAGGKSLQLADLMERKGTVVASDIRSYKLEDLRKRARRAGFPNIMTREWDGKPLRAKQCGKFDGVLVDAPCSCSGVWRRNPDGRWTAKASDVAEMAELQLSILGNASGGVRPGGVLFFATCSIFEAENRGVVQAFLAAHPEFEPEAFRHPLNGAMVTDGMLQITPADEDCDAMFAARLRRKG